LQKRQIILHFLAGFPVFPGQNAVVSQGDSRSDAIGRSASGNEDLPKAAVRQGVSMLARRLLAALLTMLLATACLSADDAADTMRETIKAKFTFTAQPATDRKFYDGKIKDGVYKGETPPSEYGHKGYVELTIRNGQVVEIVFYQYDPKTGQFKDENYGEEYGDQFGPNTFEKAQLSVEGGKKYPVMLLETQDLGQVDSVSGATFNFTVFRTAVKNACARARK
jgi:major membrane immunogen (membrane-anchored lipoprotein)